MEPVKVVDNRGSEGLCFGNVGNGVVFEVEGYYWIKVDDDCAFSLDNQVDAGFDNHEIVRPVKAKLVIED